MGLPPPDPYSLCPLSSNEFFEQPPPAEQNFWVRHCNRTWGRADCRFVNHHNRTSEHSWCITDIYRYLQNRRSEFKGRESHLIITCGPLAVVSNSLNLYESEVSIMCKRGSPVAIQSLEERDDGSWNRVTFYHTSIVNMGCWLIVLFSSCIPAANWNLDASVFRSLV